MKQEIFITIDMNVIVSNDDRYWSLDKSHVKRELVLSVPEEYAPYVKLNEVYNDLVRKALLEYMEQPHEHLEEEA